MAILIGHNLNHALNVKHNALYCAYVYNMIHFIAGDDDAEANDTRVCGDEEEDGRGSPL